MNSFHFLSFFSWLFFFKVFVGRKRGSVESCSQSFYVTLVQFSCAHYWNYGAFWEMGNRIKAIMKREDDTAKVGLLISSKHPSQVRRGRKEKNVLKNKVESSCWWQLPGFEVIVMITYTPVCIDILHSPKPRFPYIMGFVIGARQIKSHNFGHASRFKVVCFNTT